MTLIFSYFCSAMRKFPKTFLISLGLVLVLSIMNTLVPWGLRQYLEQVTERNDYGVLMMGVCLFALYLLANVFMNILWYQSLDRFGGEYIKSLSLSLEEAMAQTSYAEIEKIKPGIIRNVLYTDVLNVFRVIGHQAPSMIGALAVIMVSLGVAFAYGTYMTLFILGAVLAGVLLSWCSRTVLARTAGQTNAKMKVHDTLCTQFVEMLPLIQSHNILDYYQEKTERNLDDFINTTIREDKRTVFWTKLISGYHSLFSIALSALLAIPAAGNSVANLVFFTMIANLVMEQTQLLEQLFRTTVKSHVCFQHIDSLLQLPKRQGSRSAEAITSIAFQSVDFTYPNGILGLQGVSCSLRRGDVVRLVGQNGSGKSTFVKLLIGLYPPTSGQVLLNGRPLSEYSQESLNQQILYINQDEKCLNETFREYLEIITSGSLSQERYLELMEMVNLPDDDRRIEENGNSLSVGQRKKLFALKLILRFEEASVIILDELTAGMDVETTGRIYSLITRIAEQGDKIILITDHNLPEGFRVTTNFRFEEGKLTVD